MLSTIRCTHDFCCILVPSPLDISFGLLHERARDEKVELRIFRADCSPRGEYLVLLGLQGPAFLSERSTRVALQLPPPTITSSPRFGAES